MACKRCMKTVSSINERVICQGYCGASFHAVCAKVDLPLQEQLLEKNKNLFWMCDGCANLFSNLHFRTMMTGFDERSSALPAAFQSMHSEIEKLQSAVNSLTSKVENMPCTPTPFAAPSFWPNRNRTNTPISSKRRRVNDGNSMYISAKDDNVGTKSVSVIKTVQFDQRNDEKLLWIYLSAFHPSTTEKQIASLVCECLCLADIPPKVVKLVPKGKDPSSLQFVSFKVGVPEHLQTTALSSDTWPENIRFREFEDQRSKNGPRVVSLLPSSSQEVKSSSEVLTTNPNTDC